MTDQERITREKLLKRAAAAAGAVYAAPVLTSSAGAAINQRCKGQACGSDAKCQKRGGPELLLRQRSAAGPAGNLPGLHSVPAST